MLDNYSDSRRKSLKSKTTENSVRFDRQNILSADSNIMDIVFKAFKDAPSMQRIQMCSNCKTETKLSADLTFKIDKEEFVKLGYSRLSDLIGNELATKLDCRNCLRQKICVKANSKINVFNHVFFDTSDHCESNMSYLLSTIPKNLNIMSDEYVIAGLSSYRDKHFIAYCCVKDGWIKFDDTKKSSANVVKDEKVTLHFLLYIKKNMLNT